MLDCLVVNDFGHTVYVPKFLVPLFRASTGRDLDIDEIQYDMRMNCLPDSPEEADITNEELNSRVLYSITKEMEDRRNGVI